MDRAEGWANRAWSLQARSLALFRALKKSLDGAVQLASEAAVDLPAVPGSEQLISDADKVISRAEAAGRMIERTLERFERRSEGAAAV